VSRLVAVEGRMQLRITVGVLLFEERQEHCEGDIQMEHNRVGCPSSVFCGEHVNIRGPVMNIVNVWIPRECESNMANLRHYHGDGHHRDKPGGGIRATAKTLWRRR